MKKYMILSMLLVSSFGFEVQAAAYKDLPDKQLTGQKQQKKIKRFNKFLRIAQVELKKTSPLDIKTRKELGRKISYYKAQLAKLKG